ncbi:hypothetical protein CA601_08995 [Paraburkholderia hospita]|nr:hypothetical protein CA601_08995 [Paraburkholderia hospita]
MRKPTHIESRKGKSMGPGSFRFLLASVVVVYHYSSLGIGHTPVYLFFLLSGFWVYMMWNRKYENSRDPYLTFVLSRIWRLAPVFILCSTIAVAGVIVLPQFIAPVNAFSELTAHAFVSSFILLGYNTAAGAPLVPAWSLDVELQFYLIAPWLIVLLRRRPLMACAACVMACVVSIAVFRGGASPSYLPWFVVGMLAAQYPSLWGRRWLAASSACATLIVILAFWLIPVLRHALLGGAHPDATYIAYNPLLNIALALTALPFALQTVRTRGGAIDRFLSDASYSLYLLHWLPIFFASHYFPQLATESEWIRRLVTGCMIGATYIASLCVTAFIDRPLNQSRARFITARRVEKMAAAGAWQARP